LHLLEQPGANREHCIGLAPELVAKRQHHAEQIATVDHPAAAPEAHHRRLQQA
jgi:hypothetical protein